MGTVKSEIRPRDGDPIDYYTWWWFINDLGHRPGEYVWQCLSTGTDFSHTIREQGRYAPFRAAVPFQWENLWNSGDIIHVDAFHKRQDSKFYITPLNQCTVP